MSLAALGAAALVGALSGDARADAFTPFPPIHSEARDDANRPELDPFRAPLARGNTALA